MATKLIGVECCMCGHKQVTTKWQPLAQSCRLYVKDGVRIGGLVRCRCSWCKRSTTGTVLQIYPTGTWRDPRWRLG